MLSSIVVWYLVATAALAAVLLFAHSQKFAHSSRSARAATEANSIIQLLAEIDGKRRRGELSNAEAKKARCKLLEQRLMDAESSGLTSLRRLNRHTAALIMAGALALAFLAANYDDKEPGKVMAQAPDMSNSEVENLRAYSEMVPALPPQAVSNDQSTLADVDTMIERLKSRLEKEPKNRDGWRMLGWSYSNTRRYPEAVAAYARAIEVDPKSTELKLAYEEAKKKVDVNDNEIASTSSASTKESEGVPARVEAVAAASRDDESKTVTTMPADQQAIIRSMVDGLAARLNSSPHDVEGWVKLVRSRIVLGERDLAIKALGQALDVFASEPEPRAKITEVAKELGLGQD